MRWGEISGETNWKNTHIYYLARKDKRQLVLRHGSQVLRIFEVYRTKGREKQKRCGKYRLAEERDPSVNFLHYNYRNHNELSSIDVFNKAHELLYTLTYQEQLHQRLRIWNAPSGHVSYHFTTPRKLFLVKPSQGTTVSYEYDKRDRICKKILPEGRVIEVKYYDHGKDKDKVRALKTPGGSYTFTYYDDQTHVKDAMGCTAKYVQKDKRLAKILKCRGQTILSKEEFTWSSVGDLLGRTFEETGNVILQKKIAYDLFGNIAKETLLGNLTGEDAEFTKTCQCKNYRPMIEQEGDLTVHFAYKDNTNLLKSRFTVVEGSICKREFFEYDINGILIQEILDK